MCRWFPPCKDYGTNGGARDDLHCPVSNSVKVMLRDTAVTVAHKDAVHNKRVAGV